LPAQTKATPRLAISLNKIRAMGKGTAGQIVLHVSSCIDLDTGGLNNAELIWIGAVAQMSKGANRSSKWMRTLLPAV